MLERQSGQRGAAAAAGGGNGPPAKRVRGPAGAGVGVRRRSSGGDARGGKHAGAARERGGRVSRGASRGVSRGGGRGRGRGRSTR